jgi:hypothetical protein
MSLIPDFVLKRRPGIPKAHKFSFGVLWGVSGDNSYPHGLEDLWKVKYQHKNRKFIYWVHHFKRVEGSDKQIDKWTVYNDLPSRLESYSKLNDPWVSFENGM